MGWMETWFAFSRGEQLVVQTIGSEEGSYLRRIDSVYHSTLGVRVIQREKRGVPNGERISTSDGL